MLSKTALSRLQWLIWIAIYGGLLVISVASFLGQNDAATATAMYAAGGVLVVGGIILIYVRSRLRDPS